MKKCSKCGAEKPLDQFGADKRKVDGKKYECKDCHNLQNNVHRRANPEGYRSTNLAYARSLIGKRRQRACALRRKFWPHLTSQQAVAEYQRLHDEQCGKCALCGIKPDYTLSVDHCHETNIVRGLLCRYCNRVEVQDKTLERVLRLVAYFSKYHKAAPRKLIAGIPPAARSPSPDGLR